MPRTPGAVDRTNIPIRDSVYRYLSGNPWATLETVDRELAKDFPDRPSLRTINQWMDAYRPADTSGPWTLAPGESAADAVRNESEGRAVLAVLPSVLKARSGPVTVRQARWLATLQSVAPDQPSDERYLFAVAYASAEHDQRRVQILDTFMAFEPWRDQSAAYAAAVRNGAIPYMDSYLVPVTPATFRAIGDLVREIGDAILKGLETGEGWHGFAPEGSP